MLRWPSHHIYQHYADAEGPALKYRAKELRLGPVNEDSIIPNLQDTLRDINNDIQREALSRKANQNSKQYSRDKERRNDRNDRRPRRDQRPLRLWWKVWQFFQPFQQLQQQVRQEEQQPKGGGGGGSSSSSSTNKK